MDKGCAFKKVKEIKNKLKRYSSKKQAKILQSFFKTGPGEYGEGDVFLGVKVPCLRKIAKNYQNLGREAVLSLLHSKIHEERLLALLLLMQQYKKADDRTKKIIFLSYLDNTPYINNWDLVDISASHIVGAYLAEKSKQPLYRLVRSKIVWERRIAIVATFYFIKNNRFDDTLAIARLLLSDGHDLIHKAVGWMLREVGKRNSSLQEHFLQKHYKSMPRTMLRYAIERFPEAKKQAYLRNRINS